MIYGGSTWVLEPCKSCNGTGALGSTGMFTIYCEDCEGSCLMWVERAIIKEES